MNLKNKTILFVEDTPDSIDIHVKRLKEYDANIIINRTIDQAVETLSTKNIDYVVIDLYIPREFSKVKKYDSSTDILKMNQGELLACYIKEHFGTKIPFLYLTSQLSFYKGNDRQLLFNKSGKNIDHVIKEIAKISDPLSDRPQYK